MNTSFDLSLVVCTYNREKFLLDCLDSIASQTLERDRFELIIVNNKSTDSTADICDRFMKKTTELNTFYFLEEKQGLSHARNRGIQEAKGRIITFIDDDAIAQSDFLERILQFFEEYPNATACGGKVLAKFETKAPKWRNKFSDSLYFSHYDKGDQLFQYKGNDYPIGCNMSFKASFYAEDVAFDPNLGRKGKSGAGFEEKAVFQTLRERGLAYYYDPKQVVQHQIDDFRCEKPYTTKLSRGLGISHRKMNCDHGNIWLCLMSFVSIIFKFGASILLAIAYLFLGKPAVSKQLIWFRWLVILGFLTKK